VKHLIVLSLERVVEASCDRSAVVRLFCVDWTTATQRQDGRKNYDDDDR